MSIQDIQPIINLFAKQGISLHNARIIKTGKEAVIYYVLYENKPAALKVYKDHLVRSFQKQPYYITAKFIRRPSFRKAVRKGTKVGKKYIQDTWVKREFYLLEKLFSNGADIPKPYVQVNNAILMQYIGTEDNPAPMLKSVKLTQKEAKTLFIRILHNIEIFLKQGIIHADLSEFNVLYFNEKPYIIDFPQAVDIRTHPDKKALLSRDIRNINKFFRNAIDRSDLKASEKLFSYLK